MWQISGSPLSNDYLGPFSPDRILYEFDGPKIFTVRDREHDLCLACWSAADEQFNRFIVVPTSETIIKALEGGELPVVQALDQPRCWIWDVSHDEQILQCLKVAFQDIPADCRPTPGAMLRPELEPLLTLRAVGAAIIPGRIPGSVIRSCMEGVQKSIKLLSEFVLGRSSQQGRPAALLRRLFDLPAQHVAFGSFVISFRMPIEPRNLFTANGHASPEQETLDEVGRLLDKGLRWLKHPTEAEGLVTEATAEETAVLLRALQELTPAARGHIQTLELSGRLLPNHLRPVSLDHLSRARVTEALRKSKSEPAIVQLTGRIREVDRDRMSFELREIGDSSQSQKFVFEEQLRDQVIDALDSDELVTVAGQTHPIRNLVAATMISRLTPPSPANPGPQ